MLEIKNLSVYYGRHKALDGINLTLEKGKFYAIIGRNSSGKSTLAGSIASLLKYDGKVILDGRDVLSMPLKERTKKISILPQSVMPVPFTAYELVSFGRTPYGDINSVGREIAERVMRDVGITHLSEKRVDTLSGGERQLCYFAMNVCQDSDIMLLDEPTSNLDMEHEDRILSLAKEMCSKGKTVICVIHNLSQAVKYADGVVIVDKGECVFSGTLEECLMEEMIEKNFGVSRFSDGGKIFFSV